MKYTLSLATAFMATLTAAQYAIDPETVDIDDRRYWCSQQETQCPLICLQEANNDASTRSNECTPESLTYSCVCSSGISPNVSEYSQTLPYFICSEWGNQCVSNCGSDNLCASNCRENNPCGAQNPTRVTLTSSEEMTSTVAGQAGSTNNADAEASGDAIFTGFGTSSASETGDGSDGNGDSDSDSPQETEVSAVQDASGAARAVVLGFGQSFGLVTVVGGLLGGFALLL